jgi:two-component system nitrogen regulation response regulator GlnG
MPTLLVIDDEASILHAFKRAFRGSKAKVLTASTGKEGLAKTLDEDPDAIVLDVNLPDISGIDLFREIRERDRRIPVIFITGHGTTDTAIEAMKLGAFDYLLKPLELNQLEALIERAFEVSRLMRVPALAEGETSTRPADLLIGRSKGMQEVYKAIGRVASQNVTVLVLGETGTGKELVARAIYHHSERAEGSFHAVNCAAIPETLLESELFGHERGAFTSADRRRIGKFEQCKGGTLFLDEIGDMTPLTQAKILRVLQDQRFERVGGNETIETDVRVIAATNQPLERLMQEDRFRSDLYYRLSVFTIRLPPLRERDNDIELLVPYFLQRFGPELGKDVQSASPETYAALRQYSWPGNVRELQSVVKQAILSSSAPVLLPTDLPPEFNSVEAGNSGQGDDRFPDLAPFIDAQFRAQSPDVFEDIVQRTKRQLLLRALEATGGNQVKAAKLLGISRSTLRNELKNQGLTIDRQFEDT